MTGGQVHQTEAQALSGDAGAVDGLRGQVLAQLF